METDEDRRAGVHELRVRDASGARRVIYLATLGDAVYVLHAFEKRTRATPQRDLALAKDRLARLLAQRSR